MYISIDICVYVHICCSTCSFAAVVEGGKWSVDCSVLYNVHVHMGNLICMNLRPRHYLFPYENLTCKVSVVHGSVASEP